MTLFEKHSVNSFFFSFLKDNEELPNNISENQNTYTFNVPAMDDVASAAANMNPATNSTDTSTQPSANKFEF